MNAVHNALTSVEADEARAMARDADRRLAQAGPLHGVPFTVKLDTDVAGKITDFGSAAMRDNLAAEDVPGCRPPAPRRRDLYREKQCAVLLDARLHR